MAFKVDGYVDSLLKVGGRNVQEGDFVAKGAVLARVRQSDYRAGLDASRAQALQAAEGLKVAMWQLSQVEAIYTKASLDAERATALYQEKALTKPDYDAARAQLDSTRAQVEAARKNVEAQRNLLESAKAQERSSTITFEDTALVAPMSAVVLEKRVEHGTLVGRGTPVFRLGDLGDGPYGVRRSGHARNRTDGLALSSRSTWTRCRITRFRAVSGRSLRQRILRHGCIELRSRFRTQSNN